MNAKTPRIVSVGSKVALALVASAAAGCASSGDAAGTVPSVAAVTVFPTQPVQVYKVAPPPTIQYWSPSPGGEIRASLMNRMR